MKVPQVIQTAFALPLITFLANVCAEETPVASSADYQASCGICHLQDGRGVPGAFPPLDERIGEWAGFDAGRDYLVNVMIRGVNGQMEVDGIRYRGAMPPIAGQLHPEQVAGLLNYTLRQFSPRQKAHLFTADEITARQRNTTGSILSMRPGQGDGQ